MIIVINEIKKINMEISIDNCLINEISTDKNSNILETNN